MNTQEMLRTVQTQLAADMNCMPSDLDGEKDSFVFTQTRDNPGRRPFPRREQHFEMLSMGKSIVVSASPDILDIVKPMLYGKERDEANIETVRGLGNDDPKHRTLVGRFVGRLFIFFIRAMQANTCYPVPFWN